MSEQAIKNNKMTIVFGIIKIRKMVIMMIIIIFILLPVGSQFGYIKTTFKTLTLKNNIFFKQISSHTFCNTMQNWQWTGGGQEEGGTIIKEMVKTN